MTTLIRATPAGQWCARHLPTMSAALPWVVGGALVLGLTEALGGLEAFGLAVGVIGLVGTVAAALDARRSARQITGLVGEGEQAAQDARAAAEQVRVLTDDLGAASRADRVKAIKRTLQGILVRVDLAKLSGVPEADELVEPLGWYELTKPIERLGHVLTSAGRLSLPDSLPSHERPAPAGLS